MARAGRTAHLVRPHPREATLTLSDWIPPLLHAVPEGSPEDERAFDAFAAGVVRQLGLLAGSVLVVATLAWWPLDRWVLPGHDDVAVFARMRTNVLGVELASLTILALVRAEGRWFQALAVALYSLLLFTFAEALGASGLDPTGADPLTWLADLWIGIVPLAVLPLRTLTRLGAVLTAAAAVVGGFFAVHPANLGLPGASAQLSFAVFATSFTLIAGEGTTRLTRRTFFERRALDRARGELEALTASLSDLVAERTDALRQLTQHLDGAQESERRRLAYALHDDLGQQLTAMRYALARLGARLSSDEELSSMVQELESLLDGTRRATRGVVTRLRPRILDDLGLVPALDWFCEDLAERSRVSCTFATDADPGLDSLSDTTELALFRVAQEATTNALRHGAPSHIDLRLGIEEGSIRLSVRDDGEGFDPATQRSGFGLLGLSERLRSLDGHLAVRSVPGDGTELVATLRIPEATP